MPETKKMKIKVHGVQELWARGPFKIIEYDTEHESFDGMRMIPFKWMSFERGEAVAVILYKSDTREVVLVRQFRAPTLHLDRNGDPLNDGFLDETIAGMPLKDKPESFEDCAVREIWEETGYKVKQQDLEKISQFYVSPGGTSEIIHLYFAIVTETDRDQGWSVSLTGADAEEDTLPLHVPVSDFLHDPGRDNPDLIDSKLLIARLLLRDRLRTIAEDKTKVAKGKPSRFALDDGNIHITLRPGNLDRIKGVQIWVNPENTDMQMDRYSNGSVSAVIRYLGASKYDNDDIKEDDIANDLARKRRGVRQSHIGTVHMTTSGALQKSHGVRKIFHVATVRSLPGVQAYTPSADPKEIKLATQKVLKRIHKENKRLIISNNYTSALLPMLGSGGKGLPIEAAFPEMLNSLFEFVDTHQDTVLTEFHLNAFTSRDADIALDILKTHPRLRHLEE